MKRGEKHVFHFPSKGHQTLEPFIGHQAWNLPLATKLGTFHWPQNIRTFHWPPNLKPSIGHEAFEPSISHETLKPSIGY